MRYRRVLERSDLPLALISATRQTSGRLLVANAALSTLLARSHDELVASTVDDMTPLEDREADRRARDALLAGGEVIRHETRCLRSGGDLVHVLASVTLVNDQSGTPAAVLAALTDITPRKRYEAERETSDEFRETRERLRAAIADNALELLYEPVVDLDTGRMCSLDAIGPVQPGQGALTPAELLAMAEELDLGDVLGTWMLRRAAADSAGWQLGSREAIPVAVRVPAALLCRHDLAALVRGSVEGAASPLGLHLDELDLDEAPGRVAEQLRLLSGDEMRLVLSHVGLGYSALRTLQAVPIDGLEINPALTHALPAAHDQRVIGAIASIGRAAEITVTATGIETEEQLEAVREAGCALGKGPLLGSPGPGHDVGAILARTPTSTLFPRSRPRPALPDSAHLALGPTITLGAAADALRVSPSTLRRLADDGKIGSLRTPGGHRRFPVAEVRRFAGRSLVEHEPDLKLAPPLSAPMPIVAEALAEHGEALADRAVKAIYGATPGWYARPVAADDVHAWVRSLAEATRTGDHRALVAACSALLDRAATNGALLIETLGFLSAFFRALSAMGDKLDTGPDGARDVRHLAALCRQAVLLHVDGYD